MALLNQEIKAFIVDNFLFGVGGEQIGDQDSLITEGIIDSSGVMELVAFLESTYGFQVTDSELLPANLDSIQRIAAYVARKHPAAGSRLTPDVSNAVPATALQSA